MKTESDYARKFENFRGRTLFELLSAEQQAFLRGVAFDLRLTFQEFRRLAEIERDLAMWGQPGLEQWWKTAVSVGRGGGREFKDRILSRLGEYVAGLERGLTRYASGGGPGPPRRPTKPVVTRASDKAIVGMCPVASEKTVCCNLRTVDAVENCVFGCSYCTVQTFYTQNIVFDAEFAAKLKSVEVDPDRFYHFGTGQASDSLAWGNKNGILDALCEFAAEHPNVLVELKTKSDNVRYFMEKDVPRNVVCSWSLNTPVVIENEEHFTADLDRRLDAARAVAGRGLGVAFHFHPMVYYDGWREDYQRVASTLLDSFEPQEVQFVSFGSVTLIKPVIRKIRELGNPTKILQTELVPDPHGKLTYPDDIKVEMFATMYRAFEAWRGQVFLYLCMEKRSIWERSFGYVYADNEEFEADFGQKTMEKAGGRKRMSQTKALHRM
jgi:spore photoproduct lyase